MESPLSGQRVFHRDWLPLIQSLKAERFGIADVDTKKPIIVHDGQIIRSSVNSIEKGSNGDPGEKLASFKNVRDILGSIEKNSPYVDNENNNKTQNR